MRHRADGGGVYSTCRLYRAAQTLAAQTWLSKTHLLCYHNNQVYSVQHFPNYVVCGTLAFSVKLTSFLMPWVQINIFFVLLCVSLLFCLRMIYISLIFGEIVGQTLMKFMKSQDRPIKIWLKWP